MFLELNTIGCSLLVFLSPGQQHAWAPDAGSAGPGIAVGRILHRFLGARARIGGRARATRGRRCYGQRTGPAARRPPACAFEAPRAFSRTWYVGKRCGTTSDNPGGRIPSTPQEVMAQ